MPTSCAREKFRAAARWAAVFSTLGLFAAAALVPPRAAADDFFHDRGGHDRGRRVVVHRRGARPYAGGYARNFHFPVRDFRGRPIAGRVVINIGARRDLIRVTLASRPVLAGVDSIMLRRGDFDGRYHWYALNGVNVCHWYDAAYGRHWFGFYVGSAFFWTSYWNNEFWWYDNASARWVYYADGAWWWDSPAGVRYAYTGNGYVVEAQAAAPAPVVAQPAPAPAAAPAASGAPSYHYSGDGTRLIQIEGAANSAYLYDTTHRDPDGNYTLIRYLGDGVTGVTFTNPAYGGPAQIILKRADGYGGTTPVALDTNGNPLGGAAAAPQAPAAADETPSAPQAAPAGPDTSAPPAAAPQSAAPAQPDSGAGGPSGSGSDASGGLVPEGVTSGPGGQ